MGGDGHVGNDSGDAGGIPTTAEIGPTRARSWKADGGMLTKLGSAKADLGASKEVLILSAQISEQKQINANTNDGTVGWERVRKE